MNAKPFASLLLCFVLGLASRAALGETKTPGLTSGEVAFLKAAATSAALEIRLARLAVRQGSTVALQAYAGMLMQDHRRFSLDLKAFTAEEFMPAKLEMRVEDAALLHRLGTCDLAEFDALLLLSLLSSHEATLAAFEAQASDVTSQRLKPFVTETIPLLRAHRDMAARLSAE
ncbi:MAG: DUF4142 domain-containing protein [Verrucomicrobiaceae bacterium]|nr:DUF4142 domain-containing protein [Verrucomicrobiaceae bacterium]